MPITKKYPLDELMAALRRFPLEKGREMTIEYVLLAGYNDSPADARALARLIRGLHAKVNAIPFNEDANLPSWMKRPAEGAIDRFADALVDAGARVTVRRSKGREIAAACGQLRGKTEAKSRATRGGTATARAASRHSEPRRRRGIWGGGSCRPDSSRSSALGMTCSRAARSANSLTGVWIAPFGLSWLE